MRKILNYLVIFILIQVLLSINTAAYLDPSAITYIIQAVAGVAIAGGVALKIYWKKIKIFIKKRKEKK